MQFFFQRELLGVLLNLYAKSEGVPGNELLNTTG